jgi:thiamine-phosphate pyrophosphorylase
VIVAPVPREAGPAAITLAAMAAVREKLQRARLYFVCDTAMGAGPLETLLDAALRGGVDLIQLRDKDADERRLLDIAPIFRAAAERHNVPFILNDRPDLVARCGADGVHVGQSDASVAEARGLAGPDALIGLSSHAPDQLAAAEATSGDARPDYVSVGPVWATPTKPGRPAVGLEYVRHAASTATLPWFAIGGIDAANVAEVIGAGAARVVVVRAIRDAVDPESAARELLSSLAPPAGVPG